MKTHFGIEAAACGADDNPHARSRMLITEWPEQVTCKRCLKCRSFLWREAELKRHPKLYLEPEDR